MKTRPRSKRKLWITENGSLKLVKRRNVHLIAWKSGVSDYVDPPKGEQKAIGRVQGTTANAK